MNRLATIGLMCLALSGLASCNTPKGSTPEEQRMSVLEMRDATIRELAQKQPESKRELANAAGYAVFSNIGTQFLIMSSGNGYGVAVDNTDHTRTYMKTLGLGAGLGIGIRDYRIVMIFKNRADLVQFIDQGWDFSAGGDATAKIGDSGGSASGEASANQSVRIYQFTTEGVMVGGSLKGAKFWPDEKLNNQ